MGYKQHGVAARIGGDAALGENGLLGLSLSFERGKVDFNDDLGGFKTNMVVAALFGLYEIGDYAYVNGAVGGGYIAYNDAHRNVSLGPVVERYEGEADGGYVYGRVGAGLDIPLGDSARLNPFASYAFERVSVDSFAEEEGAASLVYGETEYRAHRVSVGLGASVAPKGSPWRFDARGAFEHDLSDSPLQISLGSDRDLLGDFEVARARSKLGQRQRIGLAQCRARLSHAWGNGDARDRGRNRLWRDVRLHGELLARRPPRHNLSNPCRSAWLG